MEREKYRVLIVATHPVQYASPVFRRMAADPRLDLEVAYCSLQGARAGLDPEFGTTVAWDVPLLEGFHWREIPNRSLRPSLNRFFGLVNPGLWGLVRHGEFDAVVSHAGYRSASFWIILAAAKRSGIPFLFGTDASSIAPRRQSSWKVAVKRLFLPRLFRRAAVALVPSPASAEYVASLGVPADRIVVSPFVADNEWWTARSAAVDRAAARRSWGIPEAAPVALFCAKLQPWKRPQDALRAFARAGIAESFLVFAGEGPLRAALEAEAAALGVTARVRFLGFQNQSQLPAVYTAADLMLLPSEYDPCPVVVCESLLCGCPVALSDEIRGRFNLIEPGRTGWIFPCGDVDALAAVLRDAFSDPRRLAAMRPAAAQRMQTWSWRENLDGFCHAIELAVARSVRRPARPAEPAKEARRPA